jgi:hypothetical protein
MVKWLLMPTLLMIGCLYYDRELLKEQNENLSLLIQNLEEELHIANKPKPAPICVPKIIEMPCEVVYTSDSCDPCRCGDD